ncbi:MAG: putative 5-formyltetrahydrofolate cyclo-ligase [Candidatus Omnitrophica bacterium ADurb.Bin277]|nr:MAG: putative 5-formyltetrahydrofolate cyclo-ligase [Candidatus Omnitrophica bacterium ADurb.Bin277]
MRKLFIKRKLRRELLNKRAAIPFSSRVKKSRRIAAKLLKEPLLNKARRVALYRDVPPEVRVSALFGTILKSKELFLPCTNTVKKTLSLRRVRSVKKDLCRGAYSIPEPRKRCPELPASQMDLIIIPGVGFDRKGNRLGRGGGYYDRLLRKAPKVPKIGVCFKEQFVKKIPVSRHDIPVDRVITD